MGKHEDWHMIGRLVAPPAAPALVRPRATYGAEHVTSEDPGTDVFESLCGNVIVDAGFAFARTMHPLKDARVKEPIDELRATDAERMLQVLLHAGTEAIDRNRKGTNQ